MFSPLRLNTDQLLAHLHSYDYLMDESANGCLIR